MSYLSLVLGLCALELGMSCSLSIVIVVARRFSPLNTLKKETNLILDSMTPSSTFATLISMKQGEKTQKIVAKYVYDRFRERDRRVKYNLV